MIRRPPRSTLFPYHDALPISSIPRPTFSALAAEPRFVEISRNPELDRKSTRLNSSHVRISYAVFCLKKKQEHERGSQPRPLAQSTPGAHSPLDLAVLHDGGRS